MGFIGRINATTTLAPREMGARDFIWLAALGSAARAPVRIEDICRAIDLITAGQWLPVADLVTEGVDEMVRGGHLAADRGKSPLLSLTSRGQATLSLMMALPTARPVSALGQVGLRFKLAFLDLVADAERRRLVNGLIEGMEHELKVRETRCDDCVAVGCFGAMWQRRDLDGIARDLALLRSMVPADGTARSGGC